MSSINPNNIDGTYPIAGQDNDSQGFRDNFTNIKNNFTFASTELSDLQNNAILKAPLSGTTLNNNLNNAQLIGAQISKFTQTRSDIGTQSGSISVNWSDAHFQTLAITANTTVTLGSWPTSGFWTSMVLDVTPKAENLYLTLAGASSFVNAVNIQGFTANAIAFPSGNVAYKFEFSTYDGGTTVTVRDLLRNYDAPIDFSSLNVTGNILAAGAVVNALTVNGVINSTGNILSAGAIHNVLAVNGNISTNGTQVELGYQQIKPTTANVANVSISPTVNRVLIHPTSVLAAFGGSFGANLTLPNTQVDGTIISISSNVTMASLSVVTPWSGTAVSPAGNAVSVAPGTVSRYMFINADKTWYKIA